MLCRTSPFPSSPSSYSLDRALGPAVSASSETKQDLAFASGSRLRRPLPPTRSESTTPLISTPIIYRPQRPRAETTGAVFVDIGRTSQHPIVRWQDQHHQHSHSVPSSSLPTEIMPTAALSSNESTLRAELRPAGRLDAPAHVKSWYTSEALVGSSRTPDAPYSLSQAGLRYNAFRDTIVAADFHRAKSSAGAYLPVRQAVPPLPAPDVDTSRLLQPLVSRMEARASVNTIEIESWLGGRPRTTHGRDDSSPLATAGSYQSAETIGPPVRPAVVIPRSQTVPANAHSDLGHQMREGPTLATPQAYLMNSPASIRSAAPFTQHHTLGLPTPMTAQSAHRPPGPQKLQRKVKTPQSPLHARFVTARSHTMSISSARVVDTAQTTPSSALRYNPDDPFQALRRPSVVGLGMQPLPPPSFAQHHHGHSSSTTSLTSNASAGSKSIARKATKVLGLPPPPDSPYGDRFYADPPRPHFVSHGGNGSVGSFASAQSPSTASQMNSALWTPVHDAYPLPGEDSPGLTARGLFVAGGGGQPVPSKAQKLLGLMPTKAERILGISEEDSSSSGHGSGAKHLSAVSSDSSWDAVHGYDEDDSVKVALEPPRLPDLRPPSGSFESLLLSFAKPASPLPSPSRRNPRPQVTRQINALAPDARESHFLPGSPTVLSRKNSKRLRLQSSVQSLRQQAARYTILSAALSPAQPPVPRSKVSMRSLRSAASAEMHVLAVSPVPPELAEALAQTNGAVKTLEEWERDGWSDDGCGPSAKGGASTESGTLGVGELMLFSPGTTEESGEVVQASVGRLSRAVSLADISEIASLAGPTPAVPARASKPQPPTSRTRAKRSDTATSTTTTQSSVNSTHTCSQPTVLLRTSSHARPQRLLHRAPLPVELVFSAASPNFYLSAKRYATLVEFLSSSPSTTFKVFPGASPKPVRHAIYVTLVEETDPDGLLGDADDDETFTLSFSMHPKAVSGRPLLAPVPVDNHLPSTLGVSAILGQRAAAGHQVARIVMRPHETVGDLLERLSSAQVGGLARET